MISLLCSEGLSFYVNAKFLHCNAVSAVALILTLILSFEAPGSKLLSYHLHALPSASANPVIDILSQRPSLGQNINERMTQKQHSLQKLVNLILTSSTLPQLLHEVIYEPLVAPVGADNLQNLVLEQHSGIQSQQNRPFTAAPPSKPHRPHQLAAELPQPDLLALNCMQACAEM